MIDEYAFLTKKEFRELSEKDKWVYVKSLKKTIQDLNIQAEKNCSECEKNLLSPEDVNLELFFEDWRNCKENCENCGKEEQRMMCDLQHNIINHLTNEFYDLKKKVNIIVTLILKKGISGSEILTKVEKELEKTNRKRRNSDEMYL